MIETLGKRITDNIKLPCPTCNAQHTPDLLTSSWQWQEKAVRVENAVQRAPPVFAHSLLFEVTASVLLVSNPLPELIRSGDVSTTSSLDHMQLRW